MGDQSRKRTNIWGEEYTEHVDSSGRKTGESWVRTGLLGNTYVQHRDSSGSKIGESREQTGLFGDPYTSHYDSSGSKIGESRERTGLFGDPYIGHSGSWHPGGPGQTGDDVFSSYNGGSSPGYSPGGGSFNYYGGSSMPTQESNIKLFFSMGFGWTLATVIVAVVYSVISIWAPIPNGNIVGPRIVLIGTGLAWLVAFVAAVSGEIKDAKNVTFASGLGRTLGVAALVAVPTLIPATLFAVSFARGRLYDDSWNPALRVPFLITLLVVPALCALINSTGVVAAAIKDGLAHHDECVGNQSVRRNLVSVLGLLGVLLYGLTLNNGIATGLFLTSLILLVGALIISPSSVARRIMGLLMLLLALAVTPKFFVWSALPEPAQRLLLPVESVVWGNGIVSVITSAGILALVVTAALVSIKPLRSTFGLVPLLGMIPLISAPMIIAGWHTDHFLVWVFPIMPALIVLVGIWGVRSRRGRTTVGEASTTAV